jgi:hypothetical protein
VVLHVSIKSSVLALPKTFTIKHRASLYFKRPFYPTQVEQLAYSTEKHLFKWARLGIRVKSIGMSLKRYSHQINAITS